MARCAATTRSTTWPAIGPDFKSHFVDVAPISNADDLPLTLAQVMGLQLPSNGNLSGRVLWEALKDGPKGVFSESRRLVSDDASSDKSTVLLYQRVGRHLYFDEACFVDVHRHDRNPCQ